MDVRKDASGRRVGMTDQTASFVDQSLAAAPARPGAIILVRHGEPALSRRCKLTSAEYRDWWATYEEGGLLGGQVPPPCLTATAEAAQTILASTRRRALETARAVAGDRPIQADDIFIEAPLPPPHLPDWFKVSPRTWGVIARFWWWAFNHHEGQETRRQAEVRAREAARRLIDRAAAGGDVLVLAHGYFNGMVGVELSRSGWRCVRDQGFHYWSARRFERR